MATDLAFAFVVASLMIGSLAAAADRPRTTG
jgi:hypothetical protein